MSDTLIRRVDQPAAEILAERAASLAQEPVDDAAGAEVSLLLFRLGVEWYAVSVGEVREIYQEYEVTPVPCVPDFIQGVVNIRGEIFSVTDLARLMGLGSAWMQGGQPPAIVVNNGDAATSMVVDEIGDIIELSEDGIEPPVGTIDRRQAEFVSGSVYVDGTLVGVVNVDRVLEPVGGAGRH